VAQVKAAGQAQDNDLSLINQYTRKSLTADDVYTMKLTLCDNEIDRQFDQFTPEALKTLSELFIGKTVILDHVWSVKGQTARIYSAQVEATGQNNSLGQPYMRLIAMAYMLNNETNAPIIEALDGGILKEGSSGFSNAKDTCSICGNDFYSSECPHMRGRVYTETGVSKTCFVILDDITDAYEFSLVAVPAQTRAGITKAFKDGRTLSAVTFKKLKAARDLRIQAMDCENQARIIEDELVGSWEPGEPEEEPDEPGEDNPNEDKALENLRKQLILI